MPCVPRGRDTRQEDVAGPPTQSRISPSIQRKEKGGARNDGAVDAMSCHRVSDRLLFALTPRVSSSLLGPVDPSFRTLSGRLEYTTRCHEFNKGSLSAGKGAHGMIEPSMQCLAPGCVPSCFSRFRPAPPPSSITCPGPTC